jgi:16S rRNA (cytidine1402-2'-O)-methyltransferase
VNDTRPQPGPPRGRLFLVPAPLDFGYSETTDIRDSLPDHTLHVAAGLRHWICENARSTRACLKRIGQIHPLVDALQALTITELPRSVHKQGDHHPVDGFDARPLLRVALEGHDVGLMSEAGMPAIADPGSSVVRAAHALGMHVVPLVGPVSLMLALAASGLNGQNFAFVGYLPQDPVGRQKRLKELEALARRTGQTQIFIETPYRNATLLRAALDALQPTTRLCVSQGLTLASGRTRSQSVAQWRSIDDLPSNDEPAVFAIGP